MADNKHLTSDASRMMRVLSEAGSISPALKELFVAEQSLRSFGLSDDATPDIEWIRKVCIALSLAAEDKRRNETAGNYQVRQKGEPAGSLISAVALELFGACIGHGMCPPAELYSLLCVLLGQEADSERAMDKIVKRTRAHDLMDDGKSDTEISNLVKVHKTTIGRWRKEGRKSINMRPTT